MNIFDLQATISLNADSLLSGLESAQGAFGGLNETISDAAGEMGSAISSLETPISDASTAFSDLWDMISNSENEINNLVESTSDASDGIVDFGDSVSDAASGIGDISDSASDAASGLSEVGGSASEAASELQGAGSAASSAASEAENSVSKWGSLKDALGGVATAAGLLTAGVGAAALGAFNVAKDAAYAADDLNTLSKQTGISTSELQKFKYASALIDVSTETFTDSLTKLTRNMNSAKEGTGSAADAFELLGIAITNEDGSLRSNQDVFYEVIDALAGVENYTERDAIAMDIFGRSAQELNPLILGGSESLKQLGQQAEDAGLILSQDALDGLNELSDAMDTAKATATAFTSVLGTAFAPSIASALTSVNGFAQEVTSAFSSGFDTGGIEGALSAIGEVISGKFAEITSGVAESVSGITGPVSELGSALQDAASSGMESFASASETLMQAFEDAGAVGVMQEVASAVQDFVSAFAGASADVISGVAEAASSFLSGFEDAGGVDVIAQVATGAADLIGAFVGASAEVIEGVAGGISSFLGAFSESSVGESIGIIATSAGDLLSAFLTAGETVINGVASGITNFLSAFDESGAVDAIASVSGLVADLFAPFSASLGDWIQKAADGLSGVAENLGTLAGNIANGIVNDVKDLADNFEKWAPWVAAIAAGLATMTIVTTVAAGFQAFTTALKSGELAANAMAVAQAALNAVMNANPIAIVIGLIAALAAGLVVAWNTNEDFRNSCIAAWEAIKEAAGTVAEAVTTFFTETIPEAFETMVDWFNGLGEKFLEIGSSIVDGLKDGIAAAWNGLSSWIGEKIDGLIGGVKDFFGIHSPSTVFAEIGENLVLGLREGWTSEFSGLERQVERDSKRLIETASVAFPDSAIGKSSAAGINSVMAAGQAWGPSGITEINLNVDGEKMAKVTYDPIKDIAAQRDDEMMRRIRLMGAASA